MPKVVEETGDEVEEEQEQDLQPEEPGEPAPPKPSDELKVVITIKDGKVMLGAQAPECDPFYTTLQGNLAVALKRVPQFVKDAMQKWSESPRYPKADLPTPPAPTPRSTPARTPAAPKKKTAQPSFF
ncbi:hypothetical protein ES703_85091 [subsurface metagenome]